MKFFYQVLLFVFLFVSADTCVYAGVNTADKSNQEKQLENFSRQIKHISRRLNTGDFEGDDISSWTKLTIKASGAASLCVSNTEATLEELEAAIEALGKPVKGESVDVTHKRKKYLSKKSVLEKQLAKCNLIKISSDEASSLLSEAEKFYFKQKYLIQGKTVISLVFTYLSDPAALFSESGTFLWAHSGIRNISLLDLSVLITGLVLSILTGIWLRRWLLKLEAGRQWHEDFSENLLRALLTTIASAAPYVLVSGTVAITSMVVTEKAEQWPFFTQALIGLLIYFSVTAGIRFLFAPPPPAKLFIGFTPDIARSLSHRLHILAVLGLVGYLGFYTVFSESITPDNLLLLRQIFSIFFVLNIIWTLAVIIRSPRLPRLRWVSYLVILALVITLGAEMSGYRNLAFAARQTILFSFVLFMVFVGLSRIFTDLFNYIDEGRYGLGKRIHQSLSIEPGSRVPGLVWIRLLVAVLIWGGFAYLLINTWDYSGGVIETIRNYLVNGFDIGEFRIVPGRIIWALLVFGLIIILSSWIRSQLETNWLKMTGMNSGARDALVTITGYVLFVIAIMAGLSIAGFDFGNITIIAGALSVGIGFGLQNIVNNFVSGLILLFERPIRKGDWIVVGGTEGVVRDIQIRSTRIQTFDRSDVIVPNSELISNQVTNWVLSSNYGRAIIPVGVAYGSDTQQVRDILLKIAEENNDIAKNNVMPGPKVLFRAFGDSSLDFELRVFLHNVDNRLSVISDINFAIDKAFREANIEIPFPQRDINIRSNHTMIEQDNNR